MRSIPKTSLRKSTIIIANWTIYPDPLFFYTITMIYFAHRGASSLAVQNTLPAFKKARELGARCYELDVHLTADGQLAVHHDYSLKDTAGVDVEIGTLTAAALKKISLHNRFSGEAVFVPMLEEVLPLVAPDLTLLNIELKNDDNRYPGVENVLLKCLHNFPQLAPNILFSSFDYDTLVRLRALDKNARIGQLTRAFNVSQACKLQAESVHIHYARVTQEILASCRENQLKVFCYTVNDPAQAKQLEALGVDGIFTDYIQLFN